MIDTLQSNKYLFRPSRTDDLHFLPDIMGTIGQCEKAATHTPRISWRYLIISPGCRLDGPCLI